MVDLYMCLSKCFSVCYPSSYSPFKMGYHITPLKGLGILLEEKSKDGKRQKWWITLTKVSQTQLRRCSYELIANKTTWKTAVEVPAGE